MEEDSILNFIRATYATLDTNAFVEILKNLDPKTVVSLCRIPEMSQFCSKDIIWKKLLKYHFPNVEYLSIEDSYIAYITNIQIKELKFWSVMVDIDGNDTYSINFLTQDECIEYVYRNMDHYFNVGEIPAFAFVRAQLKSVGNLYIQDRVYYVIEEIDFKNEELSNEKLYDMNVKEIGKVLYKTNGKLEAEEDFLDQFTSKFNEILTSTFHDLNVEFIREDIDDYYEIFFKELEKPGYILTNEAKKLIKDLLR